MMKKREITFKKRIPEDGNQKGKDWNPGRYVFLRYYYTEQRLKIFNLLNTRVPVYIVYYQTPDVENRKWRPDPKRIKFRFTQLNFKKIGPFVIGNPFKVAGLIRKDDKVVFINNYPINLMNILVVVILKLRGIKVLLWNEDIPIPQVNVSIVNRLLKWFMSALVLLFFKDILALGDFPGELYLKGRAIGKKNILKAPNAILPIADIKKYQLLPAPKSKRLILGYLGYFRQHKNLLFLLKFVSKHPEIDLILAGDGLTRPWVERYAEHYKNIRFVGYINTLEQKIEFLKKIHFLILPSIHEVWGLVVNEAIYYGVPVIVSNRVASQEIVRKIDPNLIFNIYVKSKYLKFKGVISPEQLDKAILPATYDSLEKVISYAQHIVQDPTAYNRLKKKAYALGPEYSADRLVDKLYEWFINA